MLAFEFKTLWFGGGEGVPRLCRRFVLSQNLRSSVGCCFSILVFMTLCKGYCILVDLQMVYLLRRTCWQEVGKSTGHIFLEWVQSFAEFGHIFLEWVQSFAEFGVLWCMPSSCSHMFLYWFKEGKWFSRLWKSMLLATFCLLAWEE